MPPEADKFPFTTKQKKIIDAYFPELTKLVKQHDPEVNGKCPEILVWKQDTIKAIMSNPVFKELPESQSRKKWADAVGRRLSNFMFNKLKKQLVKGTDPKPGNRDKEIALKKHLQHSLVFFTGEHSARQLFAVENDTEVQSAAKKISDAQPSYTGAPAYQMALADLWNKADHELWERKAKAAGDDISTNQNEFPLLVNKALEDICSRGGLGSTVMFLSYAYRGPDDGLQYGTIYTGYDVVTEKKINQEFDDHDAFVELWIKYAERLVPRKPKKLTIAIPRNSSGVPIFPDVDVRSGGLQEAVDVMEEYLVVLWEFSLPSGRQIPTIPWEKICNTPADYYDTQTFLLPASLNDPRLLEDWDVCLLLKFFRTQARKEPPFRFRLSNAVGHPLANPDTGLSLTALVSPTAPIPAASSTSTAPTSSGSQEPAVAHTSPVPAGIARTAPSDLGALAPTTTNTDITTTLGSPELGVAPAPATSSIIPPTTSGSSSPTTPQCVSPVPNANITPTMSLTAAPALTTPHTDVATITHAPITTSAGIAPPATPKRLPTTESAHGILSPLTPDSVHSPIAPSAVDETRVDLTATTSDQGTTSGAIRGHGPRGRGSRGRGSRGRGSRGRGHGGSEGGTQSRPPVEQATEEDGVQRSSRKRKEPDAPNPALPAKRKARK